MKTRINASAIVTSIFMLSLSLSARPVLADGPPIAVILGIYAVGWPYFLGKHLVERTEVGVEKHRRIEVISTAFNAHKSSLNQLCEGSTNIFPSDLEPALRYAAELKTEYKGKNGHDLLHASIQESSCKIIEAGYAGKFKLDEIAEYNYGNYLLTTITSGTLTSRGYLKKYRKVDPSLFSLDLAKILNRKLTDDVFVSKVHDFCVNGGTYYAAEEVITYDANGYHSVKLVPVASFLMLDHSDVNTTKILSAQEMMCRLESLKDKDVIELATYFDYRFLNKIRKKEIENRFDTKLLSP